MTNHVHLLATPGIDDSISKAFLSVGRHYVQYCNYTYQGSGTLWERRYRATVGRPGKGGNRDPVFRLSYGQEPRYPNN